MMPMLSAQTWTRRGIMAAPVKVAMKGPGTFTTAPVSSLCLSLWTRHVLLNPTEPIFLDKIYFTRWACLDQSLKYWRSGVPGGCFDSDLIFRYDMIRELFHRTGLNR